MNPFASRPDYSKLRTKKNKATEKPAPAWLKWVKVSVVLLLWLAFCYWLESWLGLIVVPFIFDVYITKKINWGWWKDLDNPARTIMSWVDAIVFALVAVYFVHNFFFQNYVIPSSSLEKTLLTGDYLLVSKLSYGPRIPMTPLTMPLTQNTLPIFNCKSYIEWPQWEYRRASGFGQVKQGDIVVFNYPAGDTLITSSTDFYRDCYFQGLQMAQMQDPAFTADTEGLTAEQQMQQYLSLYLAGKRVIQSQTNRYGSIIVRPVDRRENYVKRCVGLPGQTLQIKNKVIYTDGKPMPQPEKVQFNYWVYLPGGASLANSQYDQLCADNGISDEDRGLDSRTPRYFTLPTGGGVNQTPLTAASLAALRQVADSIVPIIDEEVGPLYPLDHDYGWTSDNYGPITIPAKGQTIALTLDNIAIYERPIRAYEGNQLEIRDHQIYINGRAAKSYTFRMNYYWMMGDNRHNSADSRFWGFVPEDHIVGKPLFVWFSRSQDRNPAASSIRWSRLFMNVGKAQ
jgi:signal peptidase I